MSLLDINEQDKDILLHLILKHYQQFSFVSKEIKILETKMYNGGQVNWDDILSNPDNWRVYYISNFKTDWDVIVIFAPNARLTSNRTSGGHILRGGYKISEIIEGIIKPSYPV